MTPERWREITALFHRALELDEPRRASFLEDACAGDPALRDQVAAMLSAHQQADAVGQIRAALATNDGESATRLAHTLKGVAGNLGAGPVQAAAAAKKLIEESGLKDITTDLNYWDTTYSGNMQVTGGEIHKRAVTHAVDHLREIQFISNAKVQSEFGSRSPSVLCIEEGALLKLLRICRRADITIESIYVTLYK